MKKNSLRAVLPEVGRLYETSRLQEIFVEKEEDRFVLCVHSSQRVCKFLNGYGKVIETSPELVIFLWRKVL